MIRVLVMEPDTANRQRLCALLEGVDFEVYEAASPANARYARGNRIGTVVANAAVLLDQDVIALAAPVPVVLVAAAPTVSEAVATMRGGAADYLPWPCESERLFAAVRSAAAKAVAPADPDTELAMIVGDSPLVRELKERLADAARADGPVLIQGEPGTGKELAAHALHDLSDRRAAPFVTLNCAATPEASIEPALFGHDIAPAPGAGGLLAAAASGTLLVKDVDRMPLAAQARLLRYIENASYPRTPPGSATLAPRRERSPNVRVLVTTHHDLRQLPANGHLVAELIDRLSETTLLVPPLRERGDDIGLLAQAVLERAADRLGKPEVQFTPAALDALRNHAWRGNVRELSHAVARAAALSDGPNLDAHLLPFGTRHGATPAEFKCATSGSLEDFFVRFVLANQDHYTETELAGQLGISRKSLWERRQRLNIPRRQTRKRGPRQPAAGRP